MTTFDALESSLEESRPVEVVRIALGGEEFLYTSAEDEITLGTDVYEPITIGRGAITQGEEERDAKLSLTVPATNAFALRYRSVPPGQKATVTVTRLQRDEVPTFATQTLVYRGFVKSVQFSDSGDTAQITLQSAEAATARNIPRFTYMPMCNHVLYDAGCGADPNDHDHTGTVTAVSGSTITLSGAGASGIDFVGGYCKPTTQSDFRLILAQSGDVLTLLLPFEVDVTGMLVQAFAGCDHLITGDCAQVFDRVAFFGGFAFVPKRNPFEKGLESP